MDAATHRWYHDSKGQRHTWLPHRYMALVVQQQPQRCKEVSSCCSGPWPASWGLQIPEQKVEHRLTA